MKQINLLGIKKCSKCNKHKLINNFYKDKSICKKCYSIKNKKYLQDHKDYYEKNKDKILKSNQNWRKNNPEKSRGCVHRWQRNNPEKLKEYIHKWQKDNKEKVNGYQRKWRENNTDKFTTYMKEYRQKNKDKILKNNREWRKNNPDKLTEYANKYLLKHPEQKKIQKKIYSTPEERKKIINARKDARKRKKGFYPLIVNIFPKDMPVDYHHISNNLPFVVPVPKTIHQKYCNGNLSMHFSNVNKWIEEVNLFNISEFLKNP